MTKLFMDPKCTFLLEKLENKLVTQEPVQKPQNKNLRRRTLFDSCKTPGKFLGPKTAVHTCVVACMLRNELQSSDVTSS